MKKIYFSGSIQGIKSENSSFAWDLVQYIKTLGHEVLTEHVAAKNVSDRDRIFLEKCGIDRTKNKIDPWFDAYRIDMKWLDDSDMVIALLDGPSYGVGMELMRAILKEERGLNKTEILCLVKDGYLNQISWMIRGIPQDKYDNFSIQIYTDLESAKSIVKNLLD